MLKKILDSESSEINTAVVQTTQGDIEVHLIYLTSLCGDC